MPCTLSLVLYKSKIETNEWSLQRRMTGQFCTLAIFGIWNAWIINKVVGSLLGKLSRRLQSCKVLSAHCCYHDHHLTEQIYTRNHKGCFSAFLICRNSREVYLQASPGKNFCAKSRYPLDVPMSNPQPRHWHMMFDNLLDEYKVGSAVLHICKKLKLNLQVHWKEKQLFLRVRCKISSPWVNTFADAK